VTPGWENFAVISGSAAGALIGREGRRGGPTGDGPEDHLARLAAAEVLALLGGVVNAWLFLTR
jgi:hypothetical protein